MSAPNALLARLEAPSAPRGASQPSRAALDAAAAFARCDRLRQIDLDWFRAGGASGFCLLGYFADPVATGWAAFQLAWAGRRSHSDGFEVRRARVQFLARKRFVFSWERRAEREASEPAFIIPEVGDDRHLVDLIAWHPKTGRLASLYRATGMLHGPAFQGGDEPLIVFSDPMAWLASCRRGVVIVHEGLARPELLQAGTIQASDVAHGEALDAMLRKVRLPRIVVPAFPAERAAA